MNSRSGLTRRTEARRKTARYPDGIRKIIEMGATAQCAAAPCIHHSIKKRLKQFFVIEVRSENPCFGKGDAGYPFG